MPWKNGGGATTEIYASTAGSGLTGEAFDWRVSIADVVQDGPFSSFDGYDRHIMLLDGNGMVLEGEPEGSIVLTEKYVPRSFSGEWNLHGRLVAGPVKDFNLMSRRSSCRSTLHCEMMQSAVEVGPTHGSLLIYILNGSMNCPAGRITAGDSLLLQHGESNVLEPMKAPAIVALCEIQPR